MKYAIYRNNQLLAEVAPQGEVTEKLFGEETVTMSFTLGNYVKFQIGDSVSVYGKSYYISTEPTIEKVSTKEYRYELIFNSIKYRLAEVQYFFYDEQNLLTMPEFSIMGTARRMIELIVSNANRTQSGWSVGVVEETETKLVDFSGYNCLAALTRISDEFGIEFWIDADKSIHLTERKTSSGYTFAYGKGKGLKSINRTLYTEASLITRLYAKGSEQNIPKGYRNGQKALRMDVPYLEINTDKYGIVEHTQTFEDIYPKRVGTVTAVNEQDYLQFSDSTLDFDLNAYNEYGTTVLIAGTSAKVIFQTGDLAGYTFEIKEYGFNSATKTFTLLKNKDEKSFEIPSENFRPKVGDQYILVDIMMPQSYVTAAEAELKAKALDYLEKNSKQRFTYTMEPDPIYFKNLNINLKLGQTVRFQDADFNLDDDIRVISLTKDLQNPYKVTFEIAEQATITQIVRNYIENEKKETAIKKGQIINAEMARRSYLFAEELKGNVFDNEGYFDAEKIKPLSIETQHISVGGRSQQFSLPNVELTLSPNQRRLRNTAGQMVHLTINENAPRTWTIGQNESPDFSTNFNYIYLRADKNGTNATFVVTEQRLMLDADPIFYHFMIGSVSSVIDGVRRIKTNYGFTQITPGEISTGRISSTNGLNYIDLLDDRIDIKAKVTFSNDSPALQQVSDSIQVGGRNLVLDSGVPKSNGVGWIIYPLSNEGISGEHTIQIWVENATPNDGGIGFGNASGYNGVFFDFPQLSNGLYKKTLNLNRGNNTHLCIWVNRQTTVKKIKLEKGNKATDWTPAPEDVEAQITTAQNTANQALGLTQAQTANITALQQKTNFLSSTAVSGNAVATGTLIVGNGLGANAGITGLGGDNDIFLWGGADYQGRNNAPISMHRDGFLRVRNAQGRVIFEIGQQNGDAVFNIYNNDGVKVAGIGQRGIEFTGYIPEDFDEKKLLRLDLVNFNDNQSLISAINTIYGTQMNGFEGINGEIYYRISFTTNATGYSYNAGRNFESAGNLQYEQYFFASKNKFGDKVANGIYALESFTITSNEANGGMYDLSVTIYDVQEGKIVRSKVVNKTGYVNNIIID